MGHMGPMRRLGAGGVGAFGCFQGHALQHGDEHVRQRMCGVRSWRIEIEKKIRITIKSENFRSGAGLRMKLFTRYSPGYSHSVVKNFFGEF